MIIVWAETKMLCRPELVMSAATMTPHFSTSLSIPNEMTEGASEGSITLLVNADDEVLASLIVSNTTVRLVGLIGIRQIVLSPSSSFVQVSVLPDSPPTLNCNN